MAFISQRQYVVTIDRIEGKFMTKSGGSISADSTKIYNGGEKTPSIITGISEVENITVGRAFDNARDRAMLTTLRSQVGRFTTTIKVQETDADYVAVGNPVVYADAVLVGITEPEYDSGSGDPAMVELEFACRSVAV